MGSEESRRARKVFVEGQVLRQADPRALRGVCLLEPPEHLVGLLWARNGWRLALSEQKETRHLFPGLLVRVSAPHLKQRAYCQLDAPIDIEAAEARPPIGRQKVLEVQKGLCI